MQDGSRAIGRKKALDVEESHLLETVKAHLGGETVLAEIGACEFFCENARVSFRFHLSNPSNVHSVVISKEPRGRFKMECYGMIKPGTLTAPLVGEARDIVVENLATVLGQLTGLESIHHRHF